MSTKTKTETPAERALRLEAERRYVAITMTDELRDAINARAKADATTAGLLCRKIVADFLNVTIDVTRAPSGTAKTDAEKLALRDEHAVLKARLLAQNKYEMANPDWITADGKLAERNRLGDAAAIARQTALAKKRAADANKPAPVAPTA